MKRRIVFALTGLALIIMPAAYARHSKSQPKPALAPAITLSEQDRQHLLQDTFIVVKTMREVPEPVRKQLLGKSKGPFEGMADSGRPFETSDMVGPKPLPFRRLVFAATSQSSCLVYYEHGGFGYGQTVELFLLSDGRAVRAWAGSLTETRRLLNLPELRTEISKGRYIDERRG